MSIERKANYYDEVYSQEDSRYTLPCDESIYFELWQRVMTLIPLELPIKDIGCGTGQFAEMLLKKHPDINYTGHDISDVAISIAINRRLKCYFYPINAYTVKFNEDDFIISLETLEHIDDFKFIDRIPMGKEIVFTVPDFNDAAHVRYFKNITEIVNRYSRHFDFSHIEKFQSWFICKAVRI